jgi:cytochrome c553
MQPSARTLLLTTVFLGWAAGTLSPQGAAQPVTITAASADLRAAYATPQDIAEGKKVAAASCARCHGMDGASTGEGVPHIAGQRAPYLHIENLVYKSGGRGTNPMSNAVKFLSDDALMKVSAYYGSLDPIPPSPPRAAPAGKAAPVKLDPVSAGKAAAAGCSGCHGETGITKIAGMPNLVGFDPKTFVAAMNAYKSGQRKHEVMKTLAAGLSETDLNNLALFYALQKPGKAQTPAPGNQAAGKAAAAGCAGCHGETGVSTNPAMPSIAGQDAEYFSVAMKAYKDGSRADPGMTGPAAGLDDNKIRDMAAYYAAQQPQAPKVRKPLTVAEWVERCDRCHGPNGNSTDPRSPALAAQRADYLERVMRAYQKEERKSAAMASMSHVLTDAEIEGIAAFYARQRPRSVVYLILPPAK